MLPKVWRTLVERWGASASGVLLRLERGNVKGESDASAWAACQRRKDPPMLDGVDGTGVANSGSGGGIDVEDDEDEDDEDEDDEDDDVEDAGVAGRLFSEGSCVS